MGQKSRLLLEAFLRIEKQISIPSHNNTSDVTFEGR
jgi:hypothetical protein